MTIGAIISERQPPRGRAVADVAAMTSVAAEIMVTAMKGRCAGQKLPPDSHIVQSRASPAKPTKPGANQCGRVVSDGCGNLGAPIETGAAYLILAVLELSALSRMSAFGRTTEVRYRLKSGRLRISQTGRLIVAKIGVLRWEAYGPCR